VTELDTATQRPDLPAAWTPAEVEAELYQRWVDRGYFTADPSSDKPPFTIVLPPPNVNGSLHMGHALNHSVMDALTRRRRMQGYEVLWLPGTDHAGIATQNAVERALAGEGLSRHDLGREKFVERVWEWREEVGGRILGQMRRLGDGVDWITALKSGAIAKLAEGGHLQLDLFDERNLISLTHEDYPGERLIACRNPALARLRAEKRQDLIAATTRELEKVAAMVAAGRLKGAGRIGLRAGKVADKYKVAKHFDLTIKDGAFAFKVNDERVAAEAALDGLYVIRTSVAEADMAAEEAVLNYKRLAEVERAFRTLKGVDLKVRPIRHRLEARVRAHILLSMLAYYVQWHMIEAWAPLTFADEAQADMGEDAARRADPVAPASRSQRALAKVHSRTLADGTPAMSFTRLLAHLATIVRNTLRPKSTRPGEATFTLTTRPTPKQQQALDLIAAITV